MESTNKLFNMAALAENVRVVGTGLTILEFKIIVNDGDAMLETVNGIRSKYFDCGVMNNV